jgi:hypothetical protein
MAISSLSPQSPKTAIDLLSARLKFKGLKADRSRVSAWCQGHFLGNRQMTVEHFRELVNLFWQQPGGLETVAEILALAGCIGKLASGQHILDLVTNLDYQWLLSFCYNPPSPFQNLHIPEHRYPVDPFTLPRENMLARLTSLLDYASSSNCPIVIYGRTGTGKSRLIAQLVSSSWGHSFEKKRAIYLNGGGMLAYLHQWHEELYGISAPVGSRIEDLVHTIRHREKTIRQIVLVDAVADLRYIQPILDIFKDTRSVVILTPHLGQTIAGLQTDKHLLTTLSGLSLAEAIELYEKGGEALHPEDLSDFAALHETLKGNPLALYYAFQALESAGLASLVSLLNGTDTDIPRFMLKEIFLNLRVGFERLPSNLQKSFARLGAIQNLDVIDTEMLAALWANSPQEFNLNKANLMVKQLQVLISPFEPIRGTTRKWRLHKPTHLFAKSKLEEMEPAEQQLAHQGFTRAAQLGNLNKPTTTR